jgi:hypothetical protein
MNREIRRRLIPTKCGAQLNGNGSALGRRPAVNSLPHLRKRAPKPAELLHPPGEASGRIRGDDLACSARFDGGKALEDDVELPVGTGALRVRIGDDLGQLVGAHRLAVAQVSVRREDALPARRAPEGARGSASGRQPRPGAVIAAALGGRSPRRHGNAGPRMRTAHRSRDRG